MITVYIAGPYSLGNVAKNVRDAVALADLLMTHGFAPYLPHLNHLWQLLFPAIQNGLHSIWSGLPDVTRSSDLRGNQLKPIWSALKRSGSGYLCF